jgi:hypothetical protein
VASAHRVLKAILLSLGLFLLAPPARAWIELGVRSDSVTIEVARDGNAIVAHEMLLKVRGGPLKEVVLVGVDEDAEPLSDATITRAHSGRAAGLPIPLSLEVSEGTLTGRIEYKKGVRSGTYFVRLRYRTDLSRAGGIRSAGSRAEVRWQSPRFDSGIDSMRVLLRVPEAPNPPALPKNAADDGTEIAEGFDGVFLGTVRRSGDHDELEIVRPHVAKGEAAVWRARVDQRAFDLDLAPKQAPGSEPDAVRTAARPSMAVPSRKPIWIGAGIAGLAYGLLLLWKAVLVRRACAERGVVARPLVRLGAGHRALLAGLCLGGAVAVALVSAQPTVAGLLLLFTVVLASHASPEVRAPLRGPGQWRRVEPAVAFAAPSAPRLPGRFFDAGSPIGFALFGLCLGAFVIVAFEVMARSAYHGVAVLLASTILFPLFCTGRAGELPLGPTGTARRTLAPLYAALARGRELGVAPIARYPLGHDEPDDLRLLVEPRRPKRGLVAIEVGFENRRNVGESLALPFAVVRITDGTASADAMPKGLLWTRGRQVEERVAVVRPRLPTRGATLALVRRLAQALSASETRRPQSASAKRRAKSSGSESSTRKAATGSRPAHAM